MEAIAATPWAAENLDDPDLLLSESNHRIANNLTLLAAAVRMKASDIKRNPRPITDVDLQRELVEIAARLEAVGTLHRLLSEAPRDGVVNFGTYLREVCDRFASTPQTHAQFVLDAMDRDCILPAQDALHLALIVQELVTNALKYAHPSGVEGRIEVSCAGEAEGALTVTVADDGVGLPDGFDPDLDGDHGFRVVRAMADHLGAKLTFETSALGLACTIRLATGRKA